MAVKKIVILAAGKGKRMGSLTQDTPKPLLPIAGKPMLAHILDRVLAAGFQSCLIVIGYRGELIRDQMCNHPLQPEFVRQDTLNGTGKAALLARDFVGNDPFLLTFGDILVEPEDYKGMAGSLYGHDAVLGVKDVDDPWQGAAVYETGGIVEKIVEKPPPGTSSTRWNSAGLYAFRPVLFEELVNLKLSPRGEYELTSAIEAMVKRGLRLRIWPIQGEWRDVGRPEDLKSAEEIV